MTGDNYLGFEPFDEFACGDPPSRTPPPIIEPNSDSPECGATCPNEDGESEHHIARRRGSADQ